VILAQVEDAYLSIKYKSKFDWLTKDLRDPEQQSTVYEGDAEDTDIGPRSTLVEPLNKDDPALKSGQQQMKI